MKSHAPVVCWIHKIESNDGIFRYLTSYIFKSLRAIWIKMHECRRRDYDISWFTELVRIYIAIFKANSFIRKLLTKSHSSCERNLDAAITSKGYLALKQG